jgi:hypothetical protein
MLSEKQSKSPVMAWIADHIDYPHEDYCLIWPFATFNGYGTFLEDGKKRFAHRVICGLKNGPPPTPKHQAAHSCNRGRFGCVNPHHLRWKTQSENLLEAPPRPKIKLCVAQAIEIRDLKGLEPCCDTADRYGVTECTVRDIQDGRTWKESRRLSKGFRDRDVQHIRSMKGRQSAKELAAQYKVRPNTIYKIWLRTSWAHVPEVTVTNC